jgi:hypothetical protein
MVDPLTPSITSRLRCRHRRRRPCNLVGRPWLPSASAWQLRASWRQLCPTASAWQLRASWPTARAWQLRALGCAPPVARGSWEPPGCVPAPSEVHVGGAPPSCDPASSSGNCKPCNQSKSTTKSSKPDPDAPARSPRLTLDS